MTATCHRQLLDELPPELQDRLAVVLDEYLVSLERGIPLPLEDVAARHPDLAEPLRVYAESLRFLCLTTEPLEHGRVARREPDATERLLGDYRLLDGSGKLWITDFGLARMPTDANLTISGSVMGTARYMSPEQAGGKSLIVDQRADIYSLGITLYELLTLEPAFDAPSPQQFLRQIEEHDPPAPRRVNPAIPAELEPIILKAIDKQRELRYPSAGELADDFRRFLDGRPTLARRPNLRDRVNRWMHRHANLAAAVVAMLLLALAATAGVSGLVAREQRRTARALETAERQLARAETNYRQTRQAIDRYGLRLAEELADIPGIEPLRHELLRDTLQCYEALLRQTNDDPELEGEQASTRFQIAEIASQLGDLPTARFHYAAAGELFLSLVDKQRENTGHRSQLSLGYNNLGLVLAASGARELSEQAFQQALRVLSRLCRDEPGEPDHRWRLALVHGNRGRMQAQLGQVADADACYRQAIRLLEPLVEQQPDRHEYIKDLAVVFNNRGALHRNGSPARAAEDNARAIELFERLAAAHPQRLNYQRELALCQSNRGVLLAETGPADQALPELRRAIALQEQLVRRAPAVVAYRRELAVSYNNLGRVLLDRHEPEDADAALDKAQALLDALSADYPGNAEHWTGAGGVLNNRAAVQEKQGRSAQAAALYEQAIERLEKAVAADAGSPESRSFLDRTLSNYERLLVSLGRADEAYRAAVRRGSLTPDTTCPLSIASPSIDRP